MKTATGETECAQAKGTTVRRLRRAARPAMNFIPELHFGARETAWGPFPDGPVTDQTLPLVDEVPAAVLLPARFVALGTERLLFSVADGLDAAGAHSISDQCVLHRSGALVAQSQVIFRGSTFVAVPFHREVNGSVLVEELHIAQHRALLIATNLGLVIVEVDVLDVLAKQVF